MTEYKQCTGCGVEKQFSEFVRLATVKSGIGARCKVCCKEASIIWYNKNKQRAADRHRQWRELNELQFLNGIKKWRHENRSKVNSSNAKRRATVLKAIPAWLTPLDHDAIRYKYTMALALSEFTGVQYHVDHIVPLQGKKVCGLHVPSNLQVMLGTDNIKKANMFEDCA